MGVNTVALAELIEHRTRKLKPIEQAEAKLPLVSKIGFEKGQIELRAGHTTKTNLVVAEDGDLLVSGINLLKGAVSLNRTGHPIAASIHYSAYRVREDVVDPAYLVLALRGQEFRAHALAELDDGVKTEVKAQRLLQFEVRLPSLPEQQRILRAVGALDRHVAAASAVVEAVGHLQAAATEHLLATSEGWRVLPGGWKAVTLADVADVRSGVTKGRKTKGLLAPVPFLRAANVQNGVLDLEEIKTIDVTETEANRFALQVGDMLMVEGSGTKDRLGRGWMWEGQVPRCLHQNHVFRARPNSEIIEPRFLAFAVGASPARTHFLESAKTTVGLSTINKTQTCELVLPLPPMAEQRRIVAELDVLRRNVDAAQRLAAAATELRAAVTADLLRSPDSVRETAETAPVLG